MVIRLFFLILFLSTYNIAQDCRNILYINTNHDESLIYIDGTFTGKGSIRIDVEKRTYYIHIRESLIKWNGYEVFDSVKIRSCNEEYHIEYNLFEKYFVDSRPQNASVTIFDNIIGYTPTYVKSESYDVIEIKKNDETRIINTEALKRNNVIMFNTINEKNRNFTESDLFKILLGSAAALGTTAAYFKIKADKKYDEYLATKDKSILEKVDRLDLYSGIAFGLLQINFGYLIYKFLIE